MTTTDPRHALRHILDLIDRDAPRDDIRAAAEQAANALADEFFGWARNRAESDIFGTEVFFEETPDKRWWVLCMEDGDEVTLIDVHGKAVRWECDPTESLLVRPDGARLTLPTAAPVVPEPRTVSTAEELDDLPAGSVITGNWGFPYAWQRFTDWWGKPGGAEPVPTSELAGSGRRTFYVRREGR